MSKLVRDMYAEAEALRKERIRADQERRRSSAAERHTNEARAEKRPRHGTRNNWKSSLDGPELEGSSP